VRLVQGQVGRLLAKITPRVLTEALAAGGSLRGILFWGRAAGRTAARHGVVHAQRREVGDARREVAEFFKRDLASEQMLERTELNRKSRELIIEITLLKVNFLAASN
jgi:hypothetical protein